MKILVTNDDGVHAPGLQVAERIAKTLSSDIWVIAPETDQSGSAHSLTFSDPLRIREIDAKRFAVRGTPTDCVIMGLKVIIGERPDLVISGVNRGQNIADDITYSGTVAGAMEGTLLGIRSIALSQAYNFHDNRRFVPWSVAETHAPPLIEKLIAMDMPEGTFLNVNFPNCPAGEVRGVAVAEQGKLLHGLFMEERRDGRGFPYFWMRFGRSPVEARDRTDIAVLRDGRIAVTPLKLDFTAHELKARLEDAIA